MFVKVVVVCALALISAVTAEAPAPAVKAKCPKGDNDCLKGALQTALRSSAALNPFTMSTNSKTLTVLTSPEGPRATLSDYKVSGLKDVVVERAAFTFSGKDAFEVTASLLIPKFAADGMYTMQLGFFGPTANRAAAGPFNMSFSDYSIDLALTGTIANGLATFVGKSADFKGGKDFDVKFVHCSHLLNKAINTAPDEFIKAYKAAVAQVYPAIVADAANQMLGKVPLEEIVA